MHRNSGCHSPPGGGRQKRRGHQAEEVAIRRTRRGTDGLHGTVQPSSAEDAGAWDTSTASGDEMPQMSIYIYIYMFI